MSDDKNDDDKNFNEPQARSEGDIDTHNGPLGFGLGGGAP